MRKKHILIVLSVIVALAAVAVVVSAGDPDNPPGPPETTDSFTLEDIYNRLDTGVAGTQNTFTEPSEGPPTGTMHTLNEIMTIAPAVDDTNGATQTHLLAGRTAWGLTSNQWGLITGTYPHAPVPRTGQTILYAVGDDGDLEKGVAWPSPRFITDTTGSTGVTVVVTDTMTGLVWPQDANCIGNEYPGFDNDGASGDGRVTWQHALDFVAGITVTGSYSNCAAGFSDWRLPNVRELQSLIDYGRYNPVLPSGHPFTGVQSYRYWSSTTAAYNTSNVWVVGLYGGSVTLGDKAGTLDVYVWPVRGGQ
jgi:hypothetical protein